MHKSMENSARKQRERQIIDEGTAIWKAKRKLDLLYAAEEKKHHWKMLASYDPWGKPGNGAPMPGALRKTKWMIENPNEEIDPFSVTTLGRPGHGAPIRNAAGKTKALTRSDPSIRFQMHDLIRGAVEKDLRYRSNWQDKENYRRELDEMICRRKKKNNGRFENKSISAIDGNKHKWKLFSDDEKEAWGRPGPGGKTWRNPNKSGRNFFTSMGWTNDAIFNSINGIMENEREQLYEISGGGVELVPLLAKNRTVAKCPLATTDVTELSKIRNQFDKAGSTAPEYHQELSNQVEEKERQKLKEKKEETIRSNKHFETWQGFWGRPGHGAPKGLSQRENLQLLLYRIPSRKLTDTCTIAQ